jgi:two-component system response regulator ResD
VKVLLVEQDAELVAATACALRRAGYTVVSVGDGATALAHWRVDHPDLVLLDPDVPYVDGFEVCRRIRYESDTPVMLLSAHGEEADVLRAFQVGADDYVTRPCSVTVLAARMQAVLRRYQPDGT